jgi:hypothetical protein
MRRRHYLDGYANLANLAVERQRVNEIKTVAEYIHFKVAVHSPHHLHTTDCRFFFARQ